MRKLRSCGRCWRHRAAGLEKHADSLEALGQRKDARIAHLGKLVAAFRQALFGRKSEKRDPDQYDLALEDIETAIAAVHAEDEADSASTGSDDAARRRHGTRSARAANRGSLPAHLPRIEQVIEPASMVCACSGGLHCIGEDVSERLDVVPAQFRVIVTRRPRHACRACTDGVVQAPAEPRLVPGGPPTEALVAHVVVSKYASHPPLYRQAQIYGREGVELDRSTLADWVGRAAFELHPVYEGLLADLKRSAKLFMDETIAPVLDPGRARCAMAISGRWRGMNGHSRRRAAGSGLHLGSRTQRKACGGHSGRLQRHPAGGRLCRGYNRLIDPVGAQQGVQLAYCWAHARRRLVEITRTGSAPIAEEGVKRIGELYQVEADIRGLTAGARLAARQERLAPLIATVAGANAFSQPHSDRTRPREPYASLAHKYLRALTAPYSIAHARTLWSLLWPSWTGTAARC